VNIKELEKFLKICRKRGVVEISWNENGVTAKFGDPPMEKQHIAEDLEQEIETDSLTDEELAFYHVQAGK